MCVIQLSELVLETNHPGAQWLAVTSDRKGGRAWGNAGAEGQDTLWASPGDPSMLLGYRLCGIGEVVDCFLSAQTAWRAHFNRKGGVLPLFPKWAHVP